MILPRTQKEMSELKCTNSKIKLLLSFFYTETLVSPLFHTKSFIKTKEQ